VPKLPIISVHNIFKSFIQNSGESLGVLSDVSFDVMQNEIVAVIGHSGCGKTTLLRIVCSLEAADSGFIFLNGNKSVKPCKDLLMLFQDFNQLLPWKTVLGNVTHSLVATKTIKSKDDAKKHALKHIADVGLVSFENSYPHQLSGGMKQRTAVARALALQPRVVLMDEPFASLDNTTRGNLQVLTRRVCEKNNISALLVTHSVEEAIIMADRIIVMDKNPGRIMTVLNNTLKDAPPNCRAKFASEILKLLRDVETSSHQNEVLG
jgi:NitT/TauT family transport system ATP-binding protein